MTLSRAPYKKLRDLYREGTEAVLPGGLVVYLVVLNQFERADVAKVSATARARIVMATKEHNSEAVERVRAEYATMTREEAISLILERKRQFFLMKAVQSVQIDPDWEERLEIMSAGEAEEWDEDDPQRALLNDINRDYLMEVQKRRKDLQDGEVFRHERMEDASLEDLFVKSFLEQIGDMAAQEAFVVAEIQQAVRACVATPPEEGEEWDHGKCEDHMLHAFESVQEVRELPDSIFDQLSIALSELSMLVTEAKDSGSQGTSSESSRLPSEEGASLPSTPEGTSNDAPGTSERPSTTP